MYNRAVLARWRDFDVMPSLEERVAYLEGRFGEHTQTTDGLRDDISDLRGEMTRMFRSVETQFGQVDKRFDSLDRRFDRNDERMESMDAKMDRHFTWVVGLEIAFFLAMFSALIGGYFK
jgi:hypothetical protein